jgi:hypothetical protein
LSRISKTVFALTRVRKIVYLPSVQVTDP